MKEYNYYWYHHMMPDKERERIQKVIDSKDYDTFVELYKHYSIEAIRHDFYDKELETWFPMTFLPSGISVWDTEKEDFVGEEYVLSKPAFMKITFSECECG